MKMNAEILYLDRDELVAALSEKKQKVLVGYKLPEWDLNPADLNAVINSGQTKLVERELAARSRDSINLTEPADNIIDAIATPEMTIVMVIASKGHGRYLVTYSILENLIVEHFVNEDGSHTLTRFRDLASLFVRIEDLIPIESINRDGRPIYEISMDQFEDLNKQITSLKPAITKIRKVLESAGVAKAHLKLVVPALTQPLLSLSMACLVVEGSEAIEASSTTLFADQQSTWGFWPKDTDSDPATFWLMPAGINDIHSTLIDWFGVREQLGNSD